MVRVIRKKIYKIVSMVKTVISRIIGRPVRMGGCDWDSYDDATRNEIWKTVNDYSNK